MKNCTERFNWQKPYFGHICRMDDSRKIKTLVFGMVDGSVSEA